MINIKKSPINVFLLSVVLFQTGTIIRLYLEMQSIGNIIRILGVIFLIYAFVRLYEHGKVHSINSNMRFLLIWNTLNIIISVFKGGINPTRLFGEEGYLLMYMLPYTLLFNVKTFDFARSFRFCIAFAILSLIVVGLNFEYVLQANELDFIKDSLGEGNMSMSFAQMPMLWSISSALVFMNTQFTKHRYVVISFVTFVLAVMFSMTFGRRGTSIYGIVFSGCGIYMYLTNPLISQKKKRRFRIIVYSLVILFIILLSNHFSFIMERGTEDSRTGIHDAFYADMTIVDYIFGRGINGTYYDPLIIFQDINFQRRGIETGYLNIILHAGLLYLIPYLILCVTSVYNGLFKSKNTLVQSFAVYILINTLMLAIGSYPVFNLRFFLLWVGILICNNRFISCMSNYEIRSYYKFETK